MHRINWFGFIFISPVLIMVLLFFLTPVVMTAFFSFTNMSTSTGIKGGEYLINQETIKEIKKYNIQKDTIEKLENAGYSINEEGLKIISEKYKESLSNEIKSLYFGEKFSNRKDLERALKKLKKNKIKKTRDRKEIAEIFKESIINERFDSKSIFEENLIKLEIDQNDRDIIIKESYTGWSWTNNNFKLIYSLPSSYKFAFYTLIYVSFTLTFNVVFGLFLAISTFYLPSKTASTFRTIWFLPRILPPVLYVLMWKWFTWDTGFISQMSTYFGASPKNWMMDSPIHAWTVIVLINGFVGASFGMILFSSAIKAIPSSMLYASEVDGANRWQQIWNIIIPQLRWPIMFTTAYQTLSLLTSFEYILLATNGGPGRSTEVWALAAYHTALQNYAGNLQYGLGATYALVLVIIGIIASLFYLKFFNFKDLVTKPRIEG